MNLRGLLTEVGAGRRRRSIVVTQHQEKNPKLFSSSTFPQTSSESSEELGEGREGKCGGGGGYSLNQVRFDLRNDLG